MELSDFPRRRIAFLPTPLVEAPRLAAAMRTDGHGPRIFVKRDDQTGLATGGNKARKLEFLIGDAIDRGCDTLITGGAAQSNHCRQTAAAAAACGLDCRLVLGGEEPPRPDGNLLLDMILGAGIHWAGEHRKGEDMPQIAEKLRKAGHRPYIIPYGGSNPRGALGFAEAVRELGAQLAATGITPSRIVFASSSGGTQAGLMVGSRLFSLEGSEGQPPELCAICIDKAAEDGIDFADRVLALANETAPSSDWDLAAARAPASRIATYYSDASSPAEGMEWSATWNDGRSGSPLGRKGFFSIRCTRDEHLAR